MPIFPKLGYHQGQRITCHVYEKPFEHIVCHYRNASHLFSQRDFIQEIRIRCQSSEMIDECIRCTDCSKPNIDGGKIITSAEAWLRALPGTSSFNRSMVWIINMQFTIKTMTIRRGSELPLQHADVTSHMPTACIDFCLSPKTHSSNMEQHIDDLGVMWLFNRFYAIIVVRSIHRAEIRSIHMELLQLHCLPWTISTSLVSLLLPNELLSKLQLWGGWDRSMSFMPIRFSALQLWYMWYCWLFEKCWSRSTSAFSMLFMF